ncbi:hypothetical protein [Bisbaumannia pacifica]|uniref:Uncharacterized protein n=1 Tax=Bisbaumannia pacifica TaxID=77098 RepID=A0ABD4KWR9_9GAMM|nr:hypothetical protein [Halomonas pacifica]MBH8578801.1 hypothetical protein [Halomonas pacifica]
MAGLLASALAGAMMGGGRAMQQNAQSRIQERRDKALKQLDHDLAMVRQNDQQQFTTSEREAGEKFTSSENQLGRRHNTALAEMRERGANRRSAAQIAAQNRRTQMGLLQQGLDAEGNTTWVNPVTGEQFNSPPGFRPASSGELSDVDNARLETINTEIEAAREQLTDETGVRREPTREEVAYIQGLARQRDAIINRTGGAGLSSEPTILEQLLEGGYGGDPGDGPPSPGGDAPPPGGGQGGGGTPPPRPDAPSSYDDLERQVAERRRAQGLIRSTQEEAQQVESEITRIRGLAAQTNFGPRTTPQQRERLANEVRQRTDALMRQHELTDAQRSRLENAVETILQRVGQ